MQEISPDVGVERPSITIQKTVGCGHIHATFITRKSGKFYKLLLRGTMTKSSPCGAVFLDFLARLLTFSLRRALEEDDNGERKDFKSTTLWKGIIKQMMGQYCNVRSIKTETSCVSAIASAIKEYIKQ